MVNPAPSTGPGPLLAPANNAPGGFEPLALGTKSVVASLPITCPKGAPGVSFDSYYWPYTTDIAV